MADESTPSSFFTEDHRQCDAQWAAVESAAGDGNLEEVRALWSRFDAAMRRHLDMEEELLFPAVEEAMHMRGMGPTQVMRMEHQQMRGLLGQMAGEVERGDFDALLDQGDTLLMLIQQHNLKEEGILYPMCDNGLRNDWPSLLERLKRMG